MEHVGGIASGSPHLLSVLASCFDDGRGVRLDSVERCYVMGRQHLSGNGRRSVTLEKPWAQLACEGKESSPTGRRPQVRTWGCSGWAGLIQEPCSRGDRKI